jgi:hypothetical protein
MIAPSGGPKRQIEALRGRSTLIWVDSNASTCPQQGAAEKRLRLCW